MRNTCMENKSAGANAEARHLEEHRGQGTKKASGMQT